MSLIFSNFGWGTVQQFGLKGASIIVYFILARLLGAEAIGVISFSYAILAISEIFITRGLPESIIQGDSLDLGQINALFINCFLWALGIFITIQIGVFFYAPQNNTISDILMSLSFLLFLRPAVVVHTALARKDFKFKQIAKIVFAATIIADGIAIYLAFHWGSIWALVVSVYIKFIIMNIWFIRLNRLKHSFIYNHNSIKKVLKYSNEVFKTKLLSFLTIRADEIIIGTFLGMTELGFYSMIMKIARAFEETFMQPFNNVMLNVFSQAKKSMLSSLDILYRAINILVTASVPYFLILAIGGNNLIPLLLGSGWVIGEFLYFLIGLQMAIRSLAYLFHSFLIAISFARYVAIGTFISFIVTLLLLIPLAQYGINYVGLGVFLRALIGLCVSLYFMSKIEYFSIRRYFSKCRYPVLFVSASLVYFISLILLKYEQSLLIAISACFVLISTFLILNISTNGASLLKDYHFIKSWKK